MEDYVLSKMNCLETYSEQFSDRYGTNVNATTKIEARFPRGFRSDGRRNIRLLIDFFYSSHQNSLYMKEAEKKGKES